MNILVDTNIWIDYLNGESYAKKLNQLLIQEEIMRHDWVEAELILGNLPKNKSFLQSYNKLTTAVNVSLSEIYEIVDKENLSRMGLSFIDVGLILQLKNRTLSYGLVIKSFKI